MAERRLTRPRDPAQLAKLIVDLATGEVDREDDGRNPADVERGKRRFLTTGIAIIKGSELNILDALNIR